MELINHLGWTKILSALSLFVFGYFLAGWLSRLTLKALGKHFSKHQTMIASRLIFYFLFIIFIISGLQQLGFKLSVLLGAAGIFTVALSFASQTAASNLISGIFLLFERPFKVGDLIEIKSLMGYVETIDLLSTKIRTGDNTLVRIPNESLIKSEITNLSYYKTRRVDILIGIAYEGDIEQAKQVLIHMAEEHPLSLKDPQPTVIIDSFADSAINLKLMVWAKRDDFFTLRNQLRDKLKPALDQAGIDIPYPQLTLHQSKPTAGTGEQS